MKTIETVYNKLNTDKTELTIHRVELGIIDMLDEMLDELKGFKDEARTADGKFMMEKEKVSKKMTGLEKNMKGVDKLLLNKWREASKLANELDAQEVKTKLKKIADFRDRYYNDALTIMRKYSK